MKKVLIALAVIAVVGAGVFFGIYEKGDLGDNVTYTLNRITGEVVISGTGEMWEEHGEPFDDNSFAKKVIIEDGVTNIAPNLFYMADITSVTIPDSVKTVGSGAFFGCRHLTSVSIPGAVTIETCAFDFCINLTSVTLGEGLQSIGDQAFGGCEKLALINIPSTVTEIGEVAFEDCTSLTSISLPDSLTEIALNTFGGCTSLADITLGTSLKLAWHGAFSNCSSLRNVYYRGTREQWAGVTILEGGAEYFFAATLHFAG